MSAKKKVVLLEVKGVLPTTSGCGVFLGNPVKTIVIYIDATVGLAITMALRNEPRERPQTHDLLAAALSGLGAQIERVVINDCTGGVFYARLFITAENELYSRKIIELDARPSDSIALACAAHAPIYMSEDLWDTMEDNTSLLHSMDQDTNPGRGIDS